jgi:hypothetical protein
VYNSSLICFALVVCTENRRGGAIVSARVEEEDAARLQGLMDRSAVRIADGLLGFIRRRSPRLFPGHFGRGIAFFVPGHDV